MVRSAEASYQITISEIPTDSLGYSGPEFEKLARDPSSFVAQNLIQAVKL